MSEVTALHGDRCVIPTCGTHVQGTIEAPRDRTAGLLLHLQTVHFPGRDLDELAAMLPALRRREGGGARQR